MNLPNALTLFRLILTVLFVIVMGEQGGYAQILALALFVAAALTDYYDGYYARQRDQVTAFGQIMDPVVDKILVLSAFYIFVREGIMPLWMLVVIAAREIGITLYRLAAMKHGRVLCAETAGKFKTVLQMFVIFIVLLFRWLMAVQPYGFWEPDDEALWRMTIELLLWATVAMTVYSGALFVINNRPEAPHGG